MLFDRLMEGKRMSHNQFDINPETRRMDVINYVHTHQCCTLTDLEGGLAERMSKKTVDKHAKELLREKILKDLEKKKKSYKLVVNKSNLSASVPIELEQFKSAIISLYTKTNETNIYSFISEGLSDATFEGITQFSENTMQLSEKRVSLILRMIDSILIQAIFKWPKIVQNKESLKLYHIAFMKISEMLLDIGEHHEIPRQILDNTVQKIALEKLECRASLFEHWRKLKNYGAQQEVEKAIDVIWTIDKGIGEIMHEHMESASEKIGFNFKHGENSRIMELNKKLKRQ
jgi:hypothetical protein